MSDIFPGKFVPPGQTLELIPGTDPPQYQLVRHPPGSMVPLVAGDATRTAREIWFAACFVAGGMLLGAILVAAVAIIRMFW